jgi:hypothetical protein
MRQGYRGFYALLSGYSAVCLYPVQAGTGCNSHQKTKRQGVFGVVRLILMKALGYLLFVPGEFCP